jgi:phosphoenolpyruvate carboxykinase (GTP)
LKWIIERCEGKGGAADTPIGMMPRFEDIELKGITGFSKKAFEELTKVDKTLRQAEVKDHERLFGELSSRMPAEMLEQRRQLEKAL